MRYVAHGPDHGLTDHLRAVAERAARCAPTGSQLWAHQAGLWHDLGKFRPGFQRYIRTDENAHIEGRGVGQRDKTHSAAGAVHALQELKQRFGEAGRRAGWLLAHLIAAHHAGLYDAADLKDRLLGSGRSDSEREHREAARACTEHESALLALPEELDASSMLFGIPGLREGEPLAQALWLRMLFSALVDADFLDTEAYLNRSQAERRAGFAPLATYLAQLDAHMDGLAARVHAAGRADEPVMRARAQVLADCRAAAAQPQGVFSLQVPTGGGKTLASLAFALRHAAAHRLARVIVAIPYTSIVEQTADVLAAIFGREAIVEHHSQSDADLALLWQALGQMFEHDRSAARGQMSTRGLYVFEHDGELGNAHAHALFDRLTIARAGDAAAPARDFGAYSVAFDGRALAIGESVAAAQGVTLTRRC